MDDIRNILDTLSHIEEGTQVDNSMKKWMDANREGYESKYPEDEVENRLRADAKRYADKIRSMYKTVSESSLPEQALEEHIKRGVPLIDSIFRPGSQAFFEVFAHAKKLQANGTLPKMDPVSQELLETDIGTWATYQGQRVPLDWPIENLTEAEYRGREVDLDKPKRGGSKAYYVYVRNPDTGNVMKVEFGSGMPAKLDDRKARKKYKNRHGCDKKGRHDDKTKPGYWSCRLPRYAKSLGLSGSGRWW